MADTHVEVPVAELEALSLEGLSTTSTVQDPSSLDQETDSLIKVEDGEPDDGSECSEDEDDKTEIATNESVPAQDGAPSTEGAPNPAAQGPTPVVRYFAPMSRMVTVFSNMILVTFPNGTPILRITTDHLDGLAKLNLAFLSYNLLDEKYGDLVLAAHKGGVDLVNAVLSATGSQVDAQEAVARFRDGERAIVSFRQALVQNGNMIENIPDDELNRHVSRIAQQVYGLLVPLISSIDDVVAVLEFIKKNYQDICRLEIDSNEYKLAVQSFDSGVATMMLYFLLAGNWYRHINHDGTQSSDEIKSLKWSELKTAIGKVNLQFIELGNNIQPDAPSAVKHRSYDYFVRVTRYVNFLGAVEEHIGWETFPIWVNKAAALGENAYAFLVTPAVDKFLEVLNPAGLANGTGSPAALILTHYALQTNQGVRIGRGLA